jgi:hypothetical protein
MQLGIAPPIVNCSSSASAVWETSAGGTELAAIAAAGGTAWLLPYHLQRTHWVARICREHPGRYILGSSGDT